MLDIGRIREELNELPFQDGRREVFVGRVSELFEGASEQAIAERLREFERQLQNHSLTSVARRR